MTLPPRKTWLWIIGGGFAGLAYFLLVGCPTGGCPLTSNPYTSTLWGAVTGGLIGWPPKRRRGATPSEPEPARAESGR